MNQKTQKLLGGKIHVITNQTLYKKLTVKQYEKLMKLIGTLFANLK